jgi:hypothetical protein
LPIKSTQISINLVKTKLEELHSVLWYLSGSQALGLSSGVLGTGLSLQRGVTDARLQKVGVIKETRCLILLQSQI